MSEEAKNKLLALLPYLYAAAQTAESQGLAKLAIAAYKPGGSGQIVAAFDAHEFLSDLSGLVGYVAPSQPK
jgi:hypothetical protein